MPGLITTYVKARSNTYRTMRQCSNRPSSHAQSLILPARVLHDSNQTVPDQILQSLCQELPTYGLLDLQLQMHLLSNSHSQNRAFGLQRGSQVLLLTWHGNHTSQHFVTEFPFASMVEGVRFQGQAEGRVTMRRAVFYIAYQQVACRLAWALLAACCAASLDQDVHVSRSCPSYGLHVQLAHGPSAGCKRNGDISTQAAFARGRPATGLWHARSLCLLLCRIPNRHV